ncbi:monodehydroascorbate reductase [Tanacetum coccineum]
MLTHNWASALKSTYVPPQENSLLAQTGDMATFMDWYCKQRGISELTPKDLEGPAFEIVKVFHHDVIHLQFQMEECHKRLTDQVDDAILRPALSISKMKAAYYPDVELEQLEATGFEFKHDYTVIDSPRAVTFRDKYGVQMIMRFNEIHKFSDGTLQQIDEALDYRVKEFQINRTNPGMNTRFWINKKMEYGDTSFHVRNSEKAPRNQDNKNKVSSRRSVPVEKSTSTALVSCDGFGGYDWSDQVKGGPNYALMAFLSSSPDSEVLRSPEIDVIGMTTIYGNVYTSLATRNALHLLEFAGRTDIPVAEGSHVSYMKATKLRVADFVHGVDGLGNQNFPQPKSKPIEKSAAQYLVEQANLYPGEAIELDPAFTKNIGQIVILGGAFAVNGNVNPAAEANVSNSL